MLKLTITRGFTMLPSTPMSVDDWNAAFLPNIALEGGVSGTDIEPGGVTFSHFNKNAFSGLPNASSWKGEDKVPFYCAANDRNESIAVSNALNSIFGLAPDGLTFTAFATDFLTYYNGSAAVRIPLARFFEQAFEKAPDYTPVVDTDYVMVSSTAADVGSKIKRVPVSTMLPVKIAGGVFTGVTGITVDNYGRVISVNATGGSGARFTATGVSVPSGAGSASTPSAHGLTAIPTEFSALLECTTTNAGWAVGDTIPLTAVFWFPGGGSNLTMPALVATADATNLSVRSFCAAADMQIQHKSTGVVTAFTPGSWKIRWSAWK